METIKNSAETPARPEVQEAIAQRAATALMIQEGIENREAAAILRRAGYEISEDSRTPKKILQEAIERAQMRYNGTND